MLWNGLYLGNASLYPALSSGYISHVEERLHNTVKERSRKGGLQLQVNFDSICLVCSEYQRNPHLPGTVSLTLLNVEVAAKDKCPQGGSSESQNASHFLEEPP